MNNNGNNGASIQLAQDAVNRVSEIVNDAIAEDMVLQYIRAFAVRPGAYYIADVVAFFWQTRVDASVASVRQFLFADNSYGPVYKSIHKDRRVFINENIGGHEYTVLDVSQWTPLYIGLANLNELSMQLLDEKWVGLRAPANYIEPYMRRNLPTIIDMLRRNNPSEWESAVSLCVIAHSTLSYLVMPTQDNIDDCYNSVAVHARVPVEMLGMYKMFVEMMKMSPDILTNYIMTTYLVSTNLTPVPIRGNMDYPMLETEDAQTAIMNEDVPQMHLDSYAINPMFPAMDMDKYNQLKDAYNSNRGYQMWFFVIYRDPRDYGFSMPSYDDVLSKFGDLLLFYGSPCVQRVHHIHVLLVVRNPRKIQSVTQKMGELFHTPSIETSAVYSKIVNVIDYMKGQSSGRSIWYNPGDIQGNYKAWCSPRDIEGGNFHPKPEFFSDCVRQGMVPYSAQQFASIAHVQVSNRLASYYAEFLRGYIRRINAKRMNPETFHVNVPIEVYHYGIEEAHRQANAVSAQTGWSIYTWRPDEHLDTEEPPNYNYEPIIVLVHGDSSEQIHHEREDTVRDRQGVWYNAEFLYVV